MNNILNVTSDIKFDDSLTQFQYHSHQPHAGHTFNRSDEIRIPIHLWVKKHIHGLEWNYGDGSYEDMKYYPLRKALTHYGEKEWKNAIS